MDSTFGGKRVIPCGAKDQGETLSFVADIKAFLDGWEEWRAVKEAAAKVPLLEARIAELESKLGGKWPADVCPSCGERAMRAQPGWRGPNDKPRVMWRCGARSYDEPRAVR
jgi:hypothetical protein